MAGGGSHALHRSSATNIIGHWKLAPGNLCLIPCESWWSRMTRRSPHFVVNGLKQNGFAVPWDQQAAFYISIRDIFNIIFSFMGIIILVIVLLSCWNIMNMTTMERIREIGTLRAIGLSIRQIGTLFVMEAFLIGFAGMTIGMLLQMILSRIINAMRIIMPPVPGMSRPYTLQVYAATWFHPLVAVGIVAAITLSSLSSFILIKRYTIVESLEHT